MPKSHRPRRQRQLDAAVATIQGRFGPWALVRGKSAPTAGSAAAGPPRIPTGFLRLDQALGIGGLPKGRICELFGPATSGKTTLALKFLAQAQRNGGHVGYIDQALYFDADYAHRCGLDLSRLLVGSTHELQEALAMVEALVRSGGLAAMVFDSLDFLWTDARAAAQLEATLNRLPAPLSRCGTTLLVLHESASGASEAGIACVANAKSPALSALAHCAAVRLQIAREHWIHEHNDVRGYKARVDIVKNRLGPAGRAATIAIKFNGTVRAGDL